MAESEQMRRESDNIGPRAELQYWKDRMAKFSSLIDQIKGQQVKTGQKITSIFSVFFLQSKIFFSVLVCLQVAKSNTLKHWQELDIKITTLANEAKDNVKYLYTLDKYCEPLYSSDPVSSTSPFSKVKGHKPISLIQVSMVEAIPGLINAIRMIYTISHFYNTSERMTSLFIKVTNQMITGK